MSYFGDNTPDEDLLNWAKHVKNEHNLTIVQLMVLLSRVMLYFAECAEA